MMALVVIVVGFGALIVFSKGSDAAGRAELALLVAQLKQTANAANGQMNELKSQYPELRSQLEQQQPELTAPALTIGNHPQLQPVTADVATPAAHVVTRQQSIVRTELVPVETGCNSITVWEDCCAAIDSRHSTPLGGHPCIPAIPGNTYKGGNMCEPKRWVNNFDFEQVADDCSAGKGSRKPLAQQVAEAAKVVAERTAARSVGCPAVQPLDRNTHPGDVENIILNRSTRWKFARHGSPRLLCYVFATLNELQETLAVSEPSPFSERVVRHLFGTGERYVGP